MRIATFNVNSINARLPFLLLWLADRKPDVALLQELKVADSEFPRDALLAAGYHAAVHGEKRWNGVAVLAKEPLELVAAGLPDGRMGARFVSARAGDLLVASVYVPNGKSVTHPDFAGKLDFLRLLREQLRAADQRGRFVIGGDFNVAHRDADSYDPEGHAGMLFHTDAERRAIDALLDLGLCDLYREIDPNGRAFSWWDYRAGSFHKNHGLRIDLLLATRAVRERTRAVWTDRDWRKKQGGHIASDHAPVIADVD